MPIKEVTMYRAVCDVCGVDNHDSEYWAWAEADQARDEWIDSDHGPVLDDGRMFCNKCIPADVCRYGDDRSGKHSPSDDGLSCVECDRPLGAPCINCGAPIHVGEAGTTDTCDGEPMHLKCPPAPVAAVSAPQDAGNG